MAPSWKEVPKKSQPIFFCICCVPVFMFVFGIAFGRPPVAIFRILASFQGAFWHHFAYLFADAVKLKNATFPSEMLGLGGAGLPFLHHVC